jgi:hypothetical protein
MIATYPVVIGNGVENSLNPVKACSVIFNPYGLEGIDTDWRGF